MGVESESAANFSTVLSSFVSRNLLRFVPGNLRWKGCLSNTFVKR